jgi:site-specific DNA-methyltransferase (adenine-specific)
MCIRPDTPDGLKPKKLIVMPRRPAFELQRDVWFLRNGIVRNKHLAVNRDVLTILLNRGGD